MSDPSAFDRLEQLLEFPVDFPLKIMGRRVDHFAQTISDLVRSHMPEFDPATIELRSSTKGTYLSLTVTVRVNCRQQLETLYNEISAHPLVRIVL